MAHWQPKDRKEFIAQDIRNDLQAEIKSLDKMTLPDLIVLALAIQEIKRARAAAHATAKATSSKEE